jgi:acyl-CoA hydrolase
MEARAAAESEVVLRQQMLPTDANSYGDVHGGVIMKLADTAAGLAAMRHARSRAVTVVVDSMTFEESVHVGDLVHVTVNLTWTGNTSMEIKVQVEAEQVVTGTVRPTSTAYFVYVALDQFGRPTAVPPLKLETEEQRAQFAAAEKRRAARLAK